MIKGSETIGAGRANADAIDLLKKTEGTYHAPIESMPLESRLTILPQGPQPTPFRLTGGK